MFSFPTTYCFQSFVIALVLITEIYKCQIPPSSPQISGQDTYSAGDSGSFTCSSSGGIPSPTVTWYKEGTLVDDSYATSGSTTSNTVSFTVSTSDHYAVYKCQVDNGVTQNPLISTQFLLVRFTPNPPVLTGPTNPSPDQQSTWTCTSVGSFPAATMTMRRGNQQYTTNEFTTSNTIDGTTKTWTVIGTLTWNPTVANNGDILYCDVTHETLTSPQTVSLPLTVVDPLAVNAPQTTYTPTIGKTITLVCQVTSGTATSIQWLKDNTLLHINTNSRLSNGNTQTPSLSITNVQQSDQGEYVCRASNSQTTVNTNTITVTPQDIGTKEELWTTESTDIGTTEELSTTESTELNETEEQAIKESEDKTTKNVLIGIVVSLVIMQLGHIVFDYWLYRKGYLRCKKSKVAQDTQQQYHPCPPQSFKFKEDTFFKQFEIDKT